MDVRQPAHMDIRWSNATASMSASTPRSHTAARSSAMTHLAGVNPRSHGSAIASSRPDLLAVTHRSKIRSSWKRTARSPSTRPDELSLRTPPSRSRCIFKRVQVMSRIGFMPDAGPGVVRSHRGYRASQVDHESAPARTHPCHASGSGRRARAGTGCSNRVLRHVPASPRSA